MGKDPAFLFYPGDWLGGTMSMTRAHKGAYMDLLMAQFNGGHLSIEDIQFVLGSDFEKMWESKLKVKFLIDEKGLFFNQKLENEILKRKNYVKSRYENLNSPKKETDMDAHKATHMGKHMENENENENVISIKDEKGIGVTGERDFVSEIIFEWNRITGQDLKPGSKVNKKYIGGRLSEGFTPEQLIEVVKKKFAQWKDDKKMSAYIRVTTLFAPEKFEGYLNEKLLIHGNTSLHPEQQLLLDEMEREPDYRPFHERISSNESDNE